MRKGPGQRIAGALCYVEGPQAWRSMKAIKNGIRQANKTISGRSGSTSERVIKRTTWNSTTATASKEQDTKANTAGAQGESYTHSVTFHLPEPP